MDCAGKRNFGLYQMEANSHLIAAAPELLGALRSCLADIEIIIDHNRNPGNKQTVSEVLLSGMEFHRAAARAAIAKATGNAQA